MPKRLPNNVVDLRIGKPIEPPKKKSAKTQPTTGSGQHKWEFKLPPRSIWLEITAGN